MGKIFLNKAFLNSLILTFLSIGAFFLLGDVFAYLGNCKDGLSGICWSRWDSGLYLEIAQKGHTLFPCKENPEQYCGNAGWAPLYPFLISGLNYVFPQFNPANIGIFLSIFFWIGTVFWANKFTENQSLIQKTPYFLLLLLAPGNVYFHAIFPMSLTVFMLFGLIWSLQKSQFIWAGIFGFFAVLSYSIGFFLIPCLFLWIVYSWKKNELKRRNAAILLAGPILGLVTWFTYDYVTIGHWNALFLVQDKYGHLINFPFKNAGTRFEILWNSRNSLSAFIEIQNFTVWGFVIFACYVFYKKRAAHFLWLFLFCYVLLFWGIPYGSSMQTALYRNVCLLLPIWFFLFRLISLKQQYLFLTIMAILALPMGKLFILSILI
jgi:hypothetical protein